MQKNFKTSSLSHLLATTALIFGSTATLAQETVFGEGRVTIGAGDSASVRNAAKQEAMRDAVIQAIKDATALDAGDPKFGTIVDSIAKQLRDVRVRDERREGPEFVTRVEAMVDRKQIKNAIRGSDLDKSIDRSFSILMLVDEFLTSTLDLKMPIEELVEYKYDAGSSYSDKSRKASASSASSQSAIAASSNVNATSAAATKSSFSSNSAMGAQSGGDSVAAAQRSNATLQSAAASQYSAKQNLAAAASAQSSNASMSQNNVAAASHEKESYKKLVKYQDNSKPTNQPQFLNDFSGLLRDYDLRLMDSANVRSKFFGNTQINLSLMSNSVEMSKFSEFARTKANADFLMMGTSTVIDAGKNAYTGQIACAINTELKAFSTSSGEMIAAVAEATQSSGINIEACKANASKKVAQLMAPLFAGRVLGYWTDRAARGRQFTVELKGNSIPIPLRLAFAKALRDIPNVSDVEKKEDGEGGVKVTMTLKGKADAMEAIYGAVSSQPAFATKNLDGEAAGELITLCLEKCGAGAPPAKSKKK